MYLDEYVCTTKNSEVPYGYKFVAIPKLPFQYETGELVLFLLGGLYIIGYWFPSVAGLNWIVQPRRRRRLQLTGKVKVELVGAIASAKVNRSRWN